MNNTQMTITERNQLQYDLRQKMWQAQQTVEFCKNEIQRLNRVYQEQFEPDLFEQMFGEKNTLWDHLDRMSDTPMAEEVYGG